MGRGHPGNPAVAASHDPRQAGENFIATPLMQ
jgi:hypothetical protein